MARWFYNAPPVEAALSERKTAELWQSLGDGFSIRWGFSYRIDHGVWREGDFLVQGPDGHILVVEAKPGEPSPDPSTGIWSTVDGQNPFTQLDREWNGALSLLEQNAETLGVQLPFVGSALALPDACLSPSQLGFAGQPRSRILDQTDLKNFSAWWKKNMSPRLCHPSLEEARRVFNSAYWNNQSDGANRQTLDFADQIIERQTKESFEILDALSDHDQLIFRGGPGTGKTWIALEVAKRWAALGRRVLFLCYNLALERWLKLVCSRLSDRIVVLSYENLAKWLLGRVHPQFKDRAERTRYFDQTLPLELAQLLSAPDFVAPFDALVVDEAQDHNTHPDLGCGLPGPGWWALYLRLLRSGAEAPVAIFHDASQRLVLRSGHFDSSSLRNALLQPVSVRLSQPLRYSRQLVRYFATLRCEHTTGLLQDMRVGATLLPSGPDPELYTGVTESEEGAVVARIVTRWVDGELARMSDILVLYPTSFDVPAWIKQGRSHGVNYQTGLDGARTDAVTAVSINQAKGLERRGVILVGLPDWEDSVLNAYRALTHVQGATRAQHLLAVVTRPRGAG